MPGLTNVSYIDNPFLLIGECDRWINWLIKYPYCATLGEIWVYCTGWVFVHNIMTKY